MNNDSPLTSIAGHFALISLLMVGGANAVFPELHRLAVDTYGWMSDPEFAAMFGIAQALPGPNVMIVSLVGLKAAGIPGAIVATAAVLAPTGALAFAVGRVWERFRTATWRRVVEHGIAPLTIGLVFSSGYVVTQSAAGTWQAYALPLGAIALMLATKINPLWLVAAGAVVGAFGLV
jgi:chromate transporter